MPRIQSLQLKSTRRHWWLATILTIVMIAYPVTPVATALAEETLPVPVDCSTIDPSTTALIDIPAACYETIPATTQLCSELFSSQYDNVDTVQPMREQYAQDCIDLAASPTDTTSSLENTAPDTTDGSPPPADVTTDQQATVATDVTDSSNTGDNSATGNADDATITTGDAGAIVDSQSGINATTTQLTDPNPPSDQPSPDTNTNQTTCQPDILCGTPTTVVTDNAADVSSMATADANTGTNDASQNGDDATITTGDATAAANVVNVVNTTVTGGNAAEVTIDIADQNTDDVNLLDLYQQMLQGGEAEINSSTTQDATVTNDVAAHANTGDNAANDNGDNATIVTGDAAAAVNLVNFVNSTAEGSNILITFINVNGDWLGNLIVPGQGVLPTSGQTTPTAVHTDQTATVSNDVTTAATTGNNTANDNGDDATITSGDAIALAAIMNILNTTVVGDNTLVILPNFFGIWNGTTVNGSNTTTGPLYGIGYGSALGGTVTDTVGSALTADTDQTATITNTVAALANTGGNQTNGNGDNAAITTGNAQALANIINVANTHLIGSNWVFTVLNVFGNWHGNLVYAYPDLSVSNSAGDHQPDNTVAPGEDVTYTLHYQNEGLAPATGVTISDSYPVNTTLVSASDNGTVQDGVITWSLNDLDPNTDTQSVTFTVHVPGDIVPPGQHTTIDNQVTIAATNTEPNLDNNVSGSSLTVVAPPLTEPQLTLTKTNDATHSLAPGDQVTYTVMVASTGSADATNVVLDDTLRNPDQTIEFAKHWSLGTIAAGTNVTISYTLTIPTDAVSGSYVNTAVATADGVTPLSATSTVTVVATPPSSDTIAPNAVPSALPDNQPNQSPHPVITVQKTNNAPQPVSSGSTVSYQVTIANDGNETIDNLTATDILRYEDPSFPNLQEKSWDIGSMLPGELISITYDIAYATAAPAGVYANMVTVTGTSDQTSTPIDESASSSVTLTSGTVLGATNNQDPQVLGASTSGTPRIQVPDIYDNSIKTLLPWWLAILIIGLLSFVYYYILYRRLHRQVKK